MKDRLPIAEELYAHLAAEFLSQTSNRQSLITVTRAQLAPRMTRGIIYVTIFPDSQEQIALGFLTRNMHEFKDFLKGRVNSRALPHLRFELDRGEKNRELIDEISRDIS